MDDRTVAFITAIRQIKKQADDQIEQTAFSGGGVRVTGFKRLSARELGNVLRLFSKRAIVKMAEGGSTSPLYVDCYDDIDPIVPVQLELPNISPTPSRTGPDYTCGSVVYSPYACTSISSESITGILMNTTLLDLVLTSTGFSVLSVAPTSVNVVGGLLTQIQNNPRMRYHSNKQKHKEIRFQRGGPMRPRWNRRARLISKLKTAFAL